MDACQARGRDIIIIATELGVHGGPVTRRYLNVLPSPNISPVSCMSPSDIVLKTGSPNSPEGENIFNFRATSEQWALFKGKCLGLIELWCIPHQQATCKRCITNRKLYVCTHRGHESHGNLGLLRISLNSSFFPGWNGCTVYPLNVLNKKNWVHKFEFILDFL